MNRRLISAFVALALAAGLVACSSESKSSSGTTITMSEYSFAVGGPIKAGEPVTLTNSGSELHMVGIGKLKDGKTLQQLTDSLNSAVDSQSDPTEGFFDGETGWPGATVAPGRSVSFSTVGLAPGNYAVICFLPVEGEQAPHFAKGMVNQVTVESGSDKTPKADATYKLTPGKPLDGPATLKAGKRTIQITGDDISKQEPQMFKASSDDQTVEQLNDALQPLFAKFEEPGGLPKGFGKDLAKNAIFFAHDLHDNKTVSFTYDFTPGTYFIAAPDTDSSNSDSVPTELIKIKVT